MTKCNLCKKDFDEGVKAAYKLGLIDGEKKAARTVSLLRVTNVEMWKEFEHLDETTPNPYDPDVIHINLRVLLGLLRTKGKKKTASVMRSYYFKQIEKIIKAQVGNLPDYIK